MLRLVFQFLVEVDGAMGMEDLVGEIAEHGGAPGRDAALRHLSDEAGEGFLDIVGVREVGRFREKVGGKVLGVAGLGFGAELAAALAIGKAMKATRRGRRRARWGSGGWRFRLGSFQG